MGEVGEEYKKLFEVFIKHFEEQMNEIGDVTLEKEHKKLIQLQKK